MVRPLLPRTQSAYQALARCPRSGEEPEDEQARLLWMVACGLCRCADDFGEHFQAERWIPAALESLIDAELLTEAEELLTLLPAGEALVHGADAEPRGRPHVHRLLSSRATYALEERLATGAQGDVWIGRQTEPIERRVAIKLVAERGDAERSAMLFREAAVMAAVAQAGVPVVCDTGTSDDGCPFLVMELIDGQPLDEFCKERELPLQERLNLFLRVCAIVEQVHHHGFLHRDLKPQNILVANDLGRTVKLIDFGLALHLAAEHNEPGRVQGTPTHMSPEQASGAAVLDRRADVYGLGVILFETVTGVSPVREADLLEAGEDISGVVGATKVPASVAFARAPNRWELAARRGTDARTLRRWLVGGLDAVVARAMATEPDERYPDVDSLAADVEAFLRDEGLGGSVTRSRGAGWWLLLVALVVAGFLAGMLWGRR